MISMILMFIYVMHYKYRENTTDSLDKHGSTYNAKNRTNLCNSLQFPARNNTSANN